MEIFIGPRGGQFRIVGGLKRYDVPGAVLQARDEALEIYEDDSWPEKWFWEWICAPVLKFLAVVCGIVLVLVLYGWMLDKFFWFTLCHSFIGWALFQEQLAAWWKAL